MVGIWRPYTPWGLPPLVRRNDQALAEVRQTLNLAETVNPSSNLALLGDKRFFRSTSGRTLLMFGDRGRSWLALWPPIGVASEVEQVADGYLRLARSRGARAGIYGLREQDLPIARRLGLALQKTGEVGEIAVADFSLSGRRREAIRRNWRKLVDAGLRIEVVSGSRLRDLLPALKAISDDWLARRSGGEKGFTMGAFEPGYVAEFPCAVVWREDRAVAFATIWPAPMHGGYSVDLMRYEDQAPANVMDFLFVELIEWGRGQGYTRFEVGMAPLSGLENSPSEQLLSRICARLYRHGEAVYNFQGVRRYKGKYDPAWEARFLGAPHGAMLALLLADLGLMTSGGLRGLARRPRSENQSASRVPPRRRP